MIGTLASVVGIVVGLGLGVGLFKLFDAVGFTLPNNGLVLHTRTVVVALIVGILVTVLASLRPAFRATRVPPIAAVREGAELPPGRFAQVPAGRLGAADARPGSACSSTACSAAASRRSRSSSPWASGRC